MSRTKHARTPKNDTSMSSMNYWSRIYDREDRRMAAAQRVRAIAKRDSLHNQIVAHLDEHAPAGLAGLTSHSFEDASEPRECDYDMFSEALLDEALMLNSVAAWERELLLWGDVVTTVEHQDEEDDEPQVEVVHSTESGDAPVRLHDREAREWDDDFGGLLPPETRLWGDPGRLSVVRVDEDEDLDDLDDDEHWIPLTSYREACDLFGVDTLVLEGPSGTSRTDSPKTAHYFRVYEVAREIGVETSALVTWLRESGEYVRGAQSFIAAPVAKNLLAHREAHVQTLGERKARPKTWAQAYAEQRKLFYPSTPRRPGAAQGGHEHLGRNPFQTGV